MPSTFLDDYIALTTIYQNSWDILGPHATQAQFDELTQEYHEDLRTLETQYTATNPHGHPIRPH